MTWLAALRPMVLVIWIAMGVIWLAFLLLRREGSPGTTSYSSGRRALLALLYLVVGGIAALCQVAAEPIAELAKSLLRGASLMAPVVFSGWTLASVVLLAFLWPVLPDLRTMIAGRMQTITLGSFKLELVPPTAHDPAVVLSPMVAADGLAMMPPYGDLPGSDGPVLDRPAVPTPAYHACLQALPSVFQPLSDNNQHTIEQQLQELEAAWPGEFAEELAISASLLGGYAAQNGVVLRGWLAKTLIFRHLMLFYTGHTEQAARLVADLSWVNPVERGRLLSHESSIRLLIALCKERQWESARQLVASAAADPNLTLPHLALGGYLATAQGSSWTGMLQAPNTDRPLSPHLLLLLALEAHASVQDGRLLHAVSVAGQVLAAPLMKDHGIGQGIRALARRSLARAYAGLAMYDPLYSLYLDCPEGREDPDVLNTLAVAAARQGQRQQAQDLLQQAAALLPAGDSPLRQTIATNQKLLQS